MILFPEKRTRTLAFSVQKLIFLKLNFFFYAYALGLPIIISGPQWLTGSLVNSLLFIASQKLSRKELLPVLILPSLGALTYGLLFGPYTGFLYYFLPFIWLGNWLLVSVFSLTKKRAYFWRVLFSSLAKSLLLSLSAHVYLKFRLVPAMFAVSMGWGQLLTAGNGGLLSFFLLKLFKEKSERKPKTN